MPHFADNVSTGMKRLARYRKEEAFILFARGKSAPLPGPSLDGDNHPLQAGSFLATSEVVKIQDHFKGNQDNSKNIEKLKYASGTTQKVYT